MFSVETLTEAQASEIADAYFKGDKDPAKMAAVLGIDRFDLNIIMHPLVRNEVVKRQRLLNGVYSIEEHISKLKEIRDAALTDENFKVALSAETQIGKAAGLYEPKLPGEDIPGESIDPTKLTTAELRRRIARSVGAVIPSQDALPAPISVDEEDEIGEV